MSNNYITPNMQLVVPIPTLESGPNWSFDLNASLTLIDSHNHSPGSGVQITPSGININADLSFNASNNIISLRTLRLSNLSSPLTASSPDLECLYGSGGNLYWNSGAGNQVQITSGGSVVGSSGTITGLPSGTASASFQSSSGTFQFQQSSGVAASIDAGAIAVRYSGGYPTFTGNYILLEAPSSIASAYSITLPSVTAIPGSGTNALTLNSSAVMGSISYDGIGQAMTSVGADAIGNTMTTVGSQRIAITMGQPGADVIADNMSSTASNILFNKVNAPSQTTSNLIGQAMNSTGSNAIASVMSSTGIGFLGIGFGVNSAAANNVAGGMTLGGANSIVSKCDNAVKSNGIFLAPKVIGGLIIGATTSSPGFTLSFPGTGLYLVHFNVPFTTVPAVVVTLYNTSNLIIPSVTTISTTQCLIQFLDTTIGAVSADFSFIAMG